MKLPELMFTKTHVFISQRFCLDFLDYFVIRTNFAILWLRCSASVQLYFVQAITVICINLYCRPLTWV